MTPIVQVIDWLITCLFHQRQGAHCCYGIVGAGRWQMGTAHDRRRTCAISMQKIGMIPTVIDAVLNHKVSKGVTQTYQRYSYDKEMADAFY